MQITKTAVEELKKMIAESGEKDAGIRIAASGGGCCGVSFNLEIAGRADADDQTITVDGLKVFVSSVAQTKLSDYTMDYSNSAAGGFTMRKKPSSSSCCG